MVPSNHIRQFQLQFQGKKKRREKKKSTPDHSIMLSVCNRIAVLKIKYDFKNKIKKEE